MNMWIVDARDNQKIKRLLSRNAYYIYFIFDEDDKQDSSSQPVSRVIVSV